MKERLLKFLEEESLSAAKFADEIGVQRSSISHILSGRNNPGYDFFQKVLKRYPQLNAEWLLMGTGKMSKTPQQASLFQVETEPGSGQAQKQVSLPDIEANIPKSPPDENKEIGSGTNSESNEIARAKSIEKLVILYTDKSFKDYIPSK